MVGRVIWVGISTVIELMKDRTIAGFFLIGTFTIMLGYVIAEMAVVERMKMFVDTCMGGIFIVSVLITLMAGANVINREIRDNEFLCTLSKPLPRSAWMIGKTGGFLVTLGVLIFSLTLFGFFYIHITTNVWVHELFLGGLLLYLEMIVLCSYTALFSTITSQYLSIFFGMLVLVIGHMVDDLKIYWASEQLASRTLTKTLFYIFPDLKAFLTGPVVHGYSQIPANQFVTLTLYSLAYLVTAVVLSVMVMNRKELG